MHFSKGIPVWHKPCITSHYSLIQNVADMKSPHSSCSILRQGNPSSVNLMSLSNYSQLSLSIMLMKKVWMWVEDGEIVPVRNRKLAAEWSTNLHSKQISFPQSHFSFSAFYLLLLFPSFNEKLWQLVKPNDFSLMFSKAKQEYAHFQVILWCD